MLIRWLLVIEVESQTKETAEVLLTEWYSNHSIRKTLYGFFELFSVNDPTDQLPFLTFEKPKQDSIVAGTKPSPGPAAQEHLYIQIRSCRIVSETLDGNYHGPRVLFWKGIVILDGSARQPYFH